MTDIYLNTSGGSDSNNGLSSGAPKATLNNAIAAMGGSGTLFVNRGMTVNVNNFIVPFAGFAVRAYGSGNRPRWNHNSTAAYAGVVINKANISFEDMIFTGSRCPVQVTSGVAGIVFRRWRWENYGGGGDPGENRGLRCNSCTGLEIDTCEFDNTAGRAGAGDHIYVDHGISANLNIHHSTFIWPGDASGDHLHTNDADNVEIHHNEFFVTGAGKGAIITGVNANNISIHDNYFENTGNYVWATGWCPNGEFYNNLVVNVQGANWSECVRLGWDPGVGGTTFVNVHDNIFVNCRRPVGSNTADTGGTMTVWVEHNTFVDPQGSGALWFEISASGPTFSNWRIRYNLVRNSAAAIITRPMPGLVFDDNWFENTPTSGTNAKTGSAGLDTNFKPTVPAAASLPYGARTGFTPPGTRPPPPANVITGTPAGETLTMPGGVDTLLDGLGGDDIFVMVPGMGNGEVGWFTRAPGVEQDRLDVSAFGWTSFSQFLANVTLEPVPGSTYSDVPWDVLIIHFNANDSVWLNGVLDILSNEVILASPPAPSGQPYAARRRFFQRHGAEGVN